MLHVKCIVNVQYFTPCHARLMLDCDCLIRNERGIATLTLSTLAPVQIRPILLHYYCS